MNEVILKVIGNYTYNTKDCLGEGVYGKVFEGYDRDTHQKVAIKKVDVTSFSHDKYLETSIFYEIFLLKNLNHPNIVRFKDVLTTKNSIYIITQFCKHGDLREALKRKKFREDEAFEVIRQIINGFSELVAEHIIHRDLKPANILINDGVYKIGDFGFAKYVENMENHMLRTCVGSPIYMSPQLLEHSYYTTKADIWSIGIISYEILFGAPPWKARNQAELLQNIRNISLSSIIRSQSVKVSTSTIDFLKRLLAYQQKDRISWQQIFGLFKIEHPRASHIPHPSHIDEPAVIKNKPPTILTSVNMTANRSSSNINEIQQNGRVNNSINEILQPRSIQIHPNNSILHPSSSQPFQAKSNPLTHKSSLLSTEQLKRLREECIYKHFVNIELQTNYVNMESVLGETIKLDRMLLLLAGLTKLKSMYILSGLHAKKQSSQGRGDLDELCRLVQKQKQYYEIGEKQITKFLEKQGTLKPIKEQVASKLSSVQGGEDRIYKAEELLLDSLTQVSRLLYHELKRKIHLMGGDSFSVVRMLDYILDIVNLLAFKGKDKSVAQLLITLARLDEFNPYEYFNKVAIRTEQTIALIF